MNLGIYVPLVVPSKNVMTFLTKECIMSFTEPLLTCGGVHVTSTAASMTIRTDAENSVAEAASAPRSIN